METKHEKLGVKQGNLDSDANLNSTTRSQGGLDSRCHKDETVFP